MSIYSQNQKQIRDPMDVLIKLELPDDSITLTYSGYSSAKVADGKLNNSTWPMRKLADLQDNGFRLNGEHVLYDPNTSASQTNGKLGVRGNIGEAVTLTVTGNKTIAALTVFASGAASVTHNGTTTNIIANQAIISVGARSITLTFNPASETQRVEISEIQPGTIFRITNENLIRATVSLRSDLSLFDQTLPESELNVEIYNDTDISEIVASIPKDSPITYSAGYPDDMSKERKFYLSGQVTWADNVISIHAVDAVHFLDDVAIMTPLYESNAYYVPNIIAYVLALAGIDVDYSRRALWTISENKAWIAKEGTSARDIIAFYNQCFNITDEDAYLIDGSGRLYVETKFTYVDAGMPQVEWDKKYSYGGDIKEEDCADIKRNIEKRIGTVKTTHQAIINPTRQTGDATFQEVGRATLIKNVGTSLSFDKYAYSWVIGMPLGENYDNDVAKKLLDKYDVIWGWGKAQQVVPVDKNGSDWGETFSNIYVPIDGEEFTTGIPLAIGEIAQKWMDPFNNSFNPNWTPYISFVPWTQKYNDWRYDENASNKITTATKMWSVLTNAKILNSSNKAVDLAILGNAFSFNPTEFTFVKDTAGDTYEYTDLPFYGEIWVEDWNADYDIKIYPDKMLTAPLYRSNKTGSFTWKGDPRHQPRDIIDFERLDGTTTRITLENITIHHEGGGTYAEYTYREGEI